MQKLGASDAMQDAQGPLPEDGRHDGGPDRAGRLLGLQRGSRVGATGVGGAVRSASSPRRA